MSENDVTRTGEMRSGRLGSGYQAARWWADLPVELQRIELTRNELPASLTPEQATVLERERKAVQAIDRWLDDGHTALIDDLAAVIDVESGLRDAEFPQAAAATTGDLIELLDLEAGLAQIVAGTAPPPDDIDDSARAAARENSLTCLISAARVNPAQRRLLSRAAVKGLLLRNRALEATERARRHIDEIGEFIDQRDGVSGRETQIRREDLEALARNRVHRVSLEIRAVGDLAEDAAIFFVSDHAEAIGRTIEDILFRGDGYAARHRERLAGQVDQLRASLRSAIDQGVVDLAVRLRCQDPIEPAEVDLAGLIELFAALSDVSGADLSGVDLSDVDLDGLRWSSGTAWPEAVRAAVRRSSQLIADDLWEVRPQEGPAAVP
ncbi:hypothetical protein JIG36_03700 [Actinoplanes sp. LDG1-06]|uniref:DUF222 domain-containing protein n=1 Tax=Paractinoplanes ovalisporus TaxID=2810368 RepID=A0ABS2A497_9ACTN|nr:hypothetical protein [Actinoplanes ovalisporus]MBM2614658.1 hypothetical protein [Actinoplanes ovalisporus]